MNQFQQNIKRPSTISQFQHYESSSSNPPENSNSTDIAKIASSGAAGFAAGGPAGALIGAGLEIGRGYLADKRNREATAKAQRHADEQATLAFNRENRSQKAAAKYNSEANQVRRFLEAGLSPGLLYGQMSDSSAQAVSAESAQNVAPVASEISKNPALLQALQLMLSQLQTTSTVALQSAQSKNLTSQTEGQDISNSYKAAQAVTEIAEGQARTNQLQKQGLLQESQANRIEELLENEKDVLAGQAALYSAEEQHTWEKINTEKTSQMLNRAQAERLIFDLNKDQEFYSYAKKLAKEHGFDERSATAVIDLLKRAPADIVQAGASALSSWISSSNLAGTLNGAAYAGMLDGFFIDLIKQYQPKPSETYGNGYFDNDPDNVALVKDPNFEEFDKLPDEIQDDIKGLNVAINSRATNADYSRWLQNNVFNHKRTDEIRALANKLEKSYKFVITQDQAFYLACRSMFLSDLESKE